MAVFPIGQPDGEIFSAATKKLFRLKILELLCRLAVPVFCLHSFFLEFAVECLFFSKNPSADRNRILYLLQLSAVSEAAVLAFLSSPQSCQATARLVFFHLCLLEQNMPTTAFHQRQQEDESKRLSLYIHKRLQRRLLSQGEKEPSTAPELQQINPSF
ncbi:MAG: hypothetical protein ACTFAL_14005 [Candidatus Electronema sp. V4]|uniref:hypothetical protein n=1 Tax=Candidatus Electronema sp. V4 TaxID=3454756 RepID=UPI0040554DE9